MPNVKVVMFEVEDWVREYLSSRGIEPHPTKMLDDPLDATNADEAADADIVSTFIYSKVDKAALDKMPNLKLITTRSTGYDHIDLQECEHRGIVVCNVPRYGENTVAEHAFALILALARKVKTAINKTNQLKFDLEGLRGFDLKDKTLGVSRRYRLAQHPHRSWIRHESPCIRCISAANTG